MPDPPIITGLDSAAAAAALKSIGPNALPQPRTPGAATIFARQFASPFIYILFAAAAVSFGLGQTINAWFIFAVLLLNATIGTVQEYAAAQAASALRALVPATANVRRDGRTQRIEVTDIVPGDILLLESGDKIGADIELLETRDLTVDESMLTGESEPVSKTPIAGSGETAESGSAYAGTVVTRGRGTGRVTATGPATTIGQIAADVGTAALVKPPLVHRIERFTLIISWAIIVVIAVMFTVTLARGDDLATVFLLGVALAVSAIPEGLPAAITVALAIGMRRMAKVNVIIRKLSAVEALGSCTFIASDKTGTLTMNEMTIKRVLLPNGHAYRVDGGAIDALDPVGDDARRRDLDRINRLILSGALANEAVIVDGADVPDIQGDRVDAAFLILALNRGSDPRALAADLPRIDEIPYESDNAYSASLNRDPRVGLQLHVKGSLERLLAMSDSAGGDGPPDRERLLAEAGELAAGGYRVLAVATRTVPETAARAADSLTNLELLGVVGIVDPLRPEALAAIAECRRAQVESAMITGDHPATALAVARELRLVGADDAAVTGADIERAERAGESALDELVARHRVFARISPAQKKTIVDRLMHLGHNVAVTGDGVNDSPALHHAHVGVAMGGRGSDVARESADLILTDDNFASIVNGIREGRIVYSNIRKVIFLLISTGAAEITLFIASLSMGLPLPLFPIQLLWLNLVTNGIQDVALAFEPAEGDELDKPPRPPSEPIFNRLMVERVVINAVYMGAVAFGVFWFALQGGASETEARNITLLLMVLFENVHALNSRSEERSLARVPPLGNPLLIVGIIAAQSIHIGSMYVPGLRDILEVEPVSLATWSKLLAVAATLVVLDEVHKFMRRASRKA